MVSSFRMNYVEKWSIMIRGLGSRARLPSSNPSSSAYTGFIKYQNVCNLSRYLTNMYHTLFIYKMRRKILTNL